MKLTCSLVMGLGALLLAVPAVAAATQDGACWNGTIHYVRSSAQISESTKPITGGTESYATKLTRVYEAAITLACGTGVANVRDRMDIKNRVERDTMVECRKHPDLPPDVRAQHHEEAAFTIAQLEGSATVQAFVTLDSDGDEYGLKFTLPSMKGGTATVTRTISDTGGCWGPSETTKTFSFPHETVSYEPSATGRVNRESPHVLIGRVEKDDGSVLEWHLERAAN